MRLTAGEHYERAGSTTYPGHQTDICLMKNVTVNTELYTVNDLSSDHNLVLLHIGGVAENTQK